MGREIEYKLRADSMQALTQAYGRVKALDTDGPERVIEMRTRYLDTPEGALRKRSWTLRIRQENDREVLTCKTPGAGHSRGEWELARISHAPSPTPEELRLLCGAGAPETLASLSGFRAVCGARFTRRCARITLSDAVIELAADAGELFGSQTAETFFELELELLAGNADRLPELAALAGLPEEPLSKQARALRLL